MASSFCLTKDLADKFKQSIIDGKIDIDKLSDMSSLERRGFFSDMMGERNAREVNSLFESKLLLKNKKKGMVTWAKQITGIRPQLKNTLVDKIMRIDNILNIKDEKLFLNDLVSKRLGTDITTEEAQRIVELTDKIKSLENYETFDGRIKYGRSKMALTEYVNELNPKKAGIITNILGIPRTLMASLDLSAPLNQGWGMISRKEFYTSFGSMFKYMVSKNMYLDLQAEILTDLNYRAAKKAGLRLTDLSENLMHREEQFMSSILDRVPGIAASQRAYTGFLNKLRMDVFNSLLKKAESKGEDVGVDSAVLNDIAFVVNSFTGGARVGKIEVAVPALNAAFFSPRKIRSTINMLNPMTYLDIRTSKTARMAALRNLVGSMAMSVSLITLYHLFGSDEPEKDPRSTNFGKIRFGDTRIDVTGGNGTYAILLARIISQSTKTNKGRVKKFGDGMYQTNAWDLSSRNLRYKLSPNASLLVDIISRSNAIGEKKTIPQAVMDRFKPMFLRDLYELAKSDSSGKIPLAVLALFGAGMNTYGEYNRNPEHDKFVNKYSKALISGDIDEKNKIRAELRKRNSGRKDKIRMYDIARAARAKNKQKTKSKRKAIRF